MSVARSVRVRGRVQGVFFRAWSREEAQSLGIAGWIRNCSDGSVEARLEGEPERITEMVSRLQKGPPGARIDLIEIEEATAEGYTEFRVRR